MDEELEGFEDDDYLYDIIGLSLVDDEDFDEQDLLDEDEYE
jgi:hypothetical protein